jgi:hypothetical protein
MQARIWRNLPLSLAQTDMDNRRRVLLFLGRTSERALIHARLALRLDCRGERFQSQRPRLIVSPKVVEPSAKAGASIDRSPYLPVPCLVASRL